MHARQVDHILTLLATQDQLYGLEGRPVAVPDQQQQQQKAGDGAGGDGSQLHFGQQWALLKFDQAVTAPNVRKKQGAFCCREKPPSIIANNLQPLHHINQPNPDRQDSAVIGARFDLDTHGDSCRLAFHGRLLALVDPSDPQRLAALRVYKVSSDCSLLHAHLTPPAL
jgi:hypothetical protein